MTRLAGLLQLVLSIVAIDGFYRIVQLTPAHDLTATEVVVAVVGLLLVLGGTAMLSLGDHRSGSPFKKRR